jgi:hypothetical protein
MKPVLSTVRWGDSRTLVVVPTLGPVRLQFPELVRVEAPHPTTWNVFGTLGGVDVADIGLGLNFEWHLLLGVGSVQSTLRFPIGAVPPQPDGRFYFQAFGVPAQWLTASMVFFAAVAVGGNWTCETWASPLGTAFPGD